VCGQNDVRVLVVPNWITNAAITEDDSALSVAQRTIMRGDG
jgi:hypothetical protein